MSRRHPRAALVLSGLLLGGCSGPDPALERAVVGMDFSRSSGVYTAPWPADDLLVDGRVQLGSFPNPEAVPLIDQLLELGAGLDGFGSTSTLYVPLSEPVQIGSLPDAWASMAPEASVYLIDVAPDSPERGERTPVDVRYLEEGGPHGPPGPSLAVLPLQGMPLRERGRYALVIRTELRDEAGYLFGQAPAVYELAAGLTPLGLSSSQADAWREALELIEERGTPIEEVAGLSVFSTGGPTEDLHRYTEHARQTGLRLVEPLVHTESFESYCVFEGEVEFPVYQHGEPPYLSEGGGWRADSAGEPEPAESQVGRIVLSLPRAAAPAEGAPVAVLIRTGAGGDRPLVDRGPRAEPGGEAIEPGTGLALDFAAVGYVGISVDGPLGGMRNLTGGDEQFLVFNVANPESMRDTLRQSALELALLPELLDELSADTSACAGAEPELRLDTSTLALVGHSMGATIAPLALAEQPRYSAAVLSGAGASWIHNVVHKQSPLEVAPLAEAMLGYSSGQLSDSDPALMLLQWVGESADPPLYARRLLRDPPAGEPARHVLMIQGIVDTYILPPIANAMTLSLGLDLGGPSLDEAEPSLEAYRSAAEVIGFARGEHVDLPMSGNRDGATAVLVQHPEDGIEDGHEVLFQTEAPRHQLRCFLADLAIGQPPTVDAGAPVGSPCP